MLEYTEFGPATGKPLLIAHGLFGSGRNWGVIAKRLSDSRRVIAVDMRNHGQSPWTDTHTYEDLASDLAEVINTLGAPMDIVGHSMGGKAAMAVALLNPEAVDRLLIGDIAPVSYGHDQSQYIGAMRAVNLSAISRRSEAEAQLAAQGIEPALCAFFTQSLDAAGQKWRFNLDTLEAEMSKILSFPKLAGQFEGPTLFLSGVDSDYVKREHRPIIGPLFPNARFAKLKNAGHWLHADDPRGFESAVRIFMGAPTS